MLLNLHIKNVAVIDELNIEFTEGFNVLTGETGAGKSIIIDAINMILGGRVNKELIRYGESKAMCEAVFFIDNKETEEVLDELGIEYEDDTLIISRDVNAEGKSICRVNGRITTAAALRDIAKTIVNIHGQHDNVSLLNPNKHITFLDSFGDTSDLLAKYSEVYNIRRSLIKEIEEHKLDETEKQRKMDLLKYQVDEIKAANLNVEEYEKLESRRSFLSEISTITDTVNNAKGRLSEANGNVYDNIAKVSAAFENIAEYDETLCELNERLKSVTLEIEDIAFTLASYADGLSYSPHELDEIENRISTIRDMERKYGPTVEAVLEYYEKISAELDEVIQNDEIIEKLTGELKATEEELAAIAKKLTDKRTSAARTLEIQIKEQLAQLDMPNSEFVVDIKTTEFCGNGCDDVEFLISANAGELPKALSKIASGGEMSRIMLAIKSILSDADAVNTLIFDEIDTGVSGRAAGKIADKLIALSSTKQILCITHLAQLASKAKSHYLIEKHVADGRTSTDVVKLKGDARVAEIARIMGGSEVTEITLKAAAELIGN